MNNMKVFTTYQNVFINNKVITYLIRVYEIEEGKYSPEVTTLTHDAILSTMIHKDLFNNQNYWSTVQDAEQAARDALHLWVENIVNDSNFKPFNIEDAKNGKQVCTSEGNPVRIICYDKEGAFPIVALVKECGFEHIATYDINGINPFEDATLCMATEKYTKYINIYSDNTYDTLEEAVKDINNPYYIKTIKVEYTK